MDTDTSEMVLDDEAVEESILDRDNRDRVLLASELDTAVAMPDLNIMEQDHPLSLFGRVARIT